MGYGPLVGIYDIDMLIFPAFCRMQGGKYKSLLLLPEPANLFFQFLPILLNLVKPFLEGGSILGGFLNFIQALRACAA